MKHSPRRAVIFWAAAVLLCQFAASPGAAEDAGEPSTYHGFVIYTWDEEPTGWDYEIFRLARNLGAGWIQAEGPLMLSESAHWGRLVPDPGADLGNPDSYDFERLDWIGAARAAGLEVVLTLSTGNDREGWNTYSPWVECYWTPQNALWENACNCLPRSWNQWYQFVFQVVSHFDEVNGPDVSVFQTIGEPGNAEGQYFQGSAEEMYGGVETVEITRHDGSTVMLPAAIVPVTYQAVHDANPDAFLALGAPYGGVDGTALAAVHELYLDLADGGFTSGEKNEIVELANSYGFDFVPVLWWFEEVDFDDIERWLFNEDNNPARRGRMFIETAIEQSQYYDIYGYHVYDSDHRRYGWLGAEGINRAMAYVGEKFRTTKPAWVNGTGLWGNSYEDKKEARSAYHLIKTLVGSYAAGMVGLTYTGISDAILLEGPASLYENRFDSNPPRVRHDAAGAFSMLARVFPAACFFDLDTVITLDPPDDDVVLYTFELNRQDPPARGFAAVGWCLDEIPEPYDRLSFDNADCPKTIDLSSILDLPPGTDFAVYEYDGELAPGSPTRDPSVTFDEAPFLVTWGDDTDGDRIPDVSDNCPEVYNPDQHDGGDLVALDGEWLMVPDGRGTLCHPRPPHRGGSRMRPNSNRKD